MHFNENFHGSSEKKTVSGQKSKLEEDEKKLENEEIEALIKRLMKEAVRPG